MSGPDSRWGVVSSGSHLIVEVEAVIVIGLLCCKSHGPWSTASMRLLSRARVVSVDDLCGTGETEAAQLIGIEAATATSRGSHPSFKNFNNLFADPYV